MGPTAAELNNLARAVNGLASSVIKLTTVAVTLNLNVVKLVQRLDELHKTLPKTSKCEVNDAVI